MTIISNSPQERQPDGRSVRDIVEHSHALVNEVWCRKILRQVLQSLDTQYTNAEPHRLIMPDTIVVRASGDAILLPDPDANADFQPEVAADLRALAAVIHYAITHEMPAAGPLAGRGLTGYSDSLLGAVDRCLAPNKAQRPQTIAELRDLLGMVSVGLLKASSAVQVAPAAPAPVAAPPVDLGPPASPRKWLWLAIAAVLLAGALYIVHQHGAEELVGAAVRVPAAPAPAPASVAPVAAPVAAPAPDTTPAPLEPTTPAAATDASAAPAPLPAGGTASYRLNVKPWGTIYVDGKRRGVSPPLKRLILPTGRHTVMVENPGFADYVVELNIARGASGLIAHDFPTTGEPAPAPATATATATAPTN